MTMKWMSKFVGLLAIVSCLGVGRSAYAVTGSWILNGSTVNYAGVNQLRIGAGEVNVNGANAALASSTVNVNTPAGIIWAGGSAAACPLKTATLMSANSADYVYYDPSGPTLVASPVAPTEAGVPTGALFFNPGTGCNGGLAAVNYVFLGSFVVNSSNAVAAFERIADQVLFLYFDTTTAWLPEFTLSFTNNSVSTVNLATLGTPWIWPTTATAIDIEQTIENNDNMSHILWLIDANWGVANTVAACSTAGFAHMPTNSTDKVILQTGQYVPALRTWWSPSTSGVTTITYEICDAAFGANPVNVVLDYRGYREPVHHLDQSL